jgi:hypothetical protein
MIPAFALAACEPPPSRPPLTPAVSRPTSPPAVQPRPTPPPDARPTRPAPPPSASSPSTATTIPSAFAPDGTRRTCASVTARPGYTCVETPNGPTEVLAPNAPPDADPCAAALCPLGAACVARERMVGGSSHRLPQCVSGGESPNAMRPDGTCAGYMCPLGHQCRLVADGPACVPVSAGW